MKSKNKVWELIKTSKLYRRWIHVFHSIQISLKEKGWNSLNIFLRSLFLFQCIYLCTYAQTQRTFTDACWMYLHSACVHFPRYFTPSFALLVEKTRRQLSSYNCCIPLFWMSIIKILIVFRKNSKMRCISSVGSLKLW